MNLDQDAIHACGDWAADHHNPPACTTTTGGPTTCSPSMGVTHVAHAPRRVVGDRERQRRECVVTPYYSDDHVTLYHGDCRVITDWLAADVLVTDPPYGIGWSGGKGKSNGPLGQPGIVGDEDTSLRDDTLARWGHERVALVFGSPLQGRPVGVRQVMAWHKPDNAGVFGALGGWRRDWEEIFLVGPWPKAPAVRPGVIKTTGGVWEYTQHIHPHGKPVGLLEYLISACPAGVISDPFAGSGSTLVAAKLQNRHAIGVEIEERYCEIAARRLSQDALPFGEAS